MSEPITRAMLDLRAAILSGDDVSTIRSAMRLSALVRYRHAQPVTLPDPMEMTR